MKKFNIKGEMWDDNVLTIDTNRYYTYVMSYPPQGGLGTFRIINRPDSATVSYVYSSNTRNDS